MATIEAADSPSQRTVAYAFGIDRAMDKCEGDFVAALEPAERERLGDLLQRLLQSSARASAR
jgi:hypothetical protein